MRDAAEIVYPREAPNDTAMAVGTAQLVQPQRVQPQRGGMSIVRACPKVDLFIAHLSAHLIECGGFRAFSIKWRIKWAIKWGKTTWMGTCRPAGAWPCLALACYRHGAPLELVGRGSNWPIFQAVAVLAFLLLFQAASFAAEPPANPSLEGTWKWTFTMPDGSQVTPRLDLKLADGKLAGATRFRAGSEMPITNLTVTGSAVSFEVVREREGAQVVTRYSGDWNGDSIKGKIVSNWTGSEETYDWEARRVTDATGTWKWSANAGGRRIDSKLTLTQDGEKLTGKITSGRGDADIKKGKIKKGDLSFEVERDRDGETLISRYYGKLTGNKIEGKMELNFTGEPRTNNWEAVRAD